MELETLRIFVKVADLGSFTAAGRRLGLSKTRVSVRVQELEAELGSRLIQRSTRSLRLTSDGEQLLVRARRLVAEAEELGAMFQAPSNLRGRVRIDLPARFARNLLIPRLPELLAAHPQLELTLSSTDLRVDVLREGFDCVLRVGELKSSSLTARRLGVLTMINCASPSYLRRHGTPENLADLAGHKLINYSIDLGAEAASFEYPDGELYRELPMQAALTVNSTDAYHAACVAGLGIVQVPRIGMEASLAAGEVIEILPHLTCRPMPVSLVHAHGRAPPQRVRAVMSWIAQLLEPRLQR